MRKRVKRILTMLLGIFVMLFGAVIIYLSLDQYEPDEETLKKVMDTQNVYEEKDYYFFDSKADNKVLIIYPGAKVDSLAYADMAIDLMNEDIDVFILRYPFNFALIDTLKADKVLDDYDYDEVYLAGHSLGGVCASMHINKHPFEFKGLVLLASYSSSKLPNDLDVLLITATNDEVMNFKAYEESISNLPKDYKEVSIEGGNHGQFGSYGFQKGDGDPKISAAEQEKIVVSNILEMIGE